MVEAAKHVDRSELLTALVAEATAMIEQARAVQAQRARAAAEAAEAAAAVKKAAEVAAEAERLRLEEEVAALTLTMQSAAMRLQQAQAQLGRSVVPPAAPAPHPDAECVVCFDAPKDHIMVPCGHQCACGACAEQLTKTRTPTCPVCHEPIQTDHEGVLLVAGFD
jgi:type IV secretory pathway TrbL component